MIATSSLSRRIIGGAVVASVVAPAALAQGVPVIDGSALANEPKFRSVIDGVGGHLFGGLVEALAASGRLITYGISGGLEASIQVRHMLLSGDGRIEGFHLYRESENLLPSR